MASHKTDALINEINKYMLKSREKTASNMDPSGMCLNLIEVMLSCLYNTAGTEESGQMVQKSVSFFTWDF